MISFRHFSEDNTIVFRLKKKKKVKNILRPENIEENQREREKRTLRLMNHYVKKKSIFNYPSLNMSRCSHLL